MLFNLVQFDVVKFFLICLIACVCYVEVVCALTIIGYINVPFFLL